MKDIGLVTFFDGNYGSMLQCFSTKAYIESKGYRCRLFSQVIPIEDKCPYLLKKFIYLLVMSLRYPAFLKKYKEMRQSSKLLSVNLGKFSEQKMNEFVQIHLQPIRSDYKLFKKMTNTEDFIGVFSGSDQIWNGAAPVNDFFFLRFAPKNKRVALAPSFGVDEIAEYNQKIFKKYISEYHKISAREENGKRIIKRLLDLEVQQLADPVVLKSASEWRQIYRQNAKEKDLSNYVFVFFINKPNEIAMKKIRALKDGKYTILEFGYHHDVLAQEGVMLQDGGPFDFLSLIDNAELILTDSFHAVMFSILFNKNFRVFQRQYNHKQTQQSRLTNVLEFYGLSNRMIMREEDDEEFSMYCVEEIIEKERIRLKQFIDQSIDEWDCSDGSSYIKSRGQCVGCQVCLSVCPVHAIYKVKDEFGYEICQIDQSACVKCGRCAKVCNYKHNHIMKKQAFVCFNRNEYLRAHSASGGVFSAIAEDFLAKGAVVYGACYDSASKMVKHIRVDSPNNLLQILGSKYVESDISSVYADVKIQLRNNKKVLFCGTSCQVNALLGYLQNENCDNLFTIDLICHGVPGRELFADYIGTIEKDYKGQVIDVKFRIKQEGVIHFGFEFSIKCSNKTIRVWKNVEESAYFYLFMKGESYREACYNCEYAKLDKPSDITIGDYLELNQDYPHIYKSLYPITDINAVIVHTDKGAEMLKINALQTIEVDLNKVQLSHPQLCNPSIHTKLRYKFASIYKKHGIKGVNSFYRIYRKILVLGKRLLKR